MTSFSKGIAAVAAALACGLSFGHVQSVDGTIASELRAGHEVSVLVLLDDSAEQSQIAGEERDLPDLAHRAEGDYTASMRRREERLGALKKDFLSRVGGSGLESVQDFRILPILHFKLGSVEALSRLQANAKVKSIELDKQFALQLLHSLPLIGQPTASANGQNGAGTSVCVLDTGIQPGYFSSTNTLGNPAISTTPFVMCTQGVGQTGCNVLVNQLIGAATGSTSTHGSNVSGIVLGVAPATKIVALGVFGGSLASTTDIIAGIDFCTINKATYNIASLNLSLGDSSANAVPLPTTDSYGTAISIAIQSGITVVASAGNDAHANGLSLPAAYSGVMSVGALYSASWGAQAWGSPLVCTDSTTNPNQIACFSNSATYLSMLAPGAVITSAGIKDGGTSQAAPHVSGAVAAIRAANPDYSVDQVFGALQRGPLTTDLRNGYATPRLDLRASLPSPQISAGNTHTCVLTGAGGVECWGDNTYGQLGNGTQTSSLTPVPVVGLASGVVAVAAGAWHSCAILLAGGVMCWGDNTYGELGNGTNTSSATPVAVLGLNSGFVSVSAGAAYTCIVDSTGLGACWGYNGSGQLGNGSTTNTNAPVLVSGLSTAIQIFASYVHTCALTNTGSVLCWGYNGYGELGNGTTVSSSTPVVVTGLSSGMVAVAPGWYHTCGINVSGAVGCWGQNAFGQLGIGNETQYTTPVAVPTFASGAVAIGSGQYHSCALTGTGRVDCWGADSYSPVSGGGFTGHTFSTIPVAVSGLNGVPLAIDVRSRHTCDRTKAGVVQCWGDDSSGQLGNAAPDQATPVSVLGVGGAGHLNVLGIRPASSDLNGDGFSDVIWRQASTGATYVWFMNGGVASGSTYLGASSDWSVIATGDFNGDGTADLVWRQASTGATYLWLMNGTSILSTAYLGASTDWSVVATGDFNGDGKTDLVWRQASTGATYIWFMNGGVVGSTAFLGSNADWSVVATGDFNGDGMSDLVWRQASTGATYIWLMNGASTVGSGYLGGSTDWTVIATGDFNGDGKTDLVWRQVSTGATYMWLMSGLSVSNSAYVGGNSDWSVVTTGDYDGSGKSDLVWRQASTGATYIWLMNGSTVTSSAYLGSNTDWYVTGGR